MSSVPLVVSILGTRPEAIKMAPLVQALNRSSKLEHQLWVTAQHRQMLDQVLQIFGLSPSLDLDIMQPKQRLSQLSSRILMGLDRAFQVNRPDLVLVHGDTTTTLMASLTAFYHRIPVGHVEAGLRTHHRYQPWPEEINRTLTADIAELHFAPTPLARKNLLSEGISPSKIWVTGNTVIDALFKISEQLEQSQPPLEQLLKQNVQGQRPGSALIAALESDQKMILVTGHRRENWGEPLRHMIQAIVELRARYPKVFVVFPVHLNPKVRGPVFEFLRGDPGIFLIPPVDYLPFVYLMNRAYLILTDSGGIQEEAPALGKPVLVMREKSERMEAIEAGTAKLVGTQMASIVQACSMLLDDTSLYEKMASAQNPFGDGQASKRICAIIEDWL